MAIALRENFIKNLDEVYKVASKSSVLDDNTGTVTFLADSNTFKYPKLDMDGLGDYSRSSGYTDGEVNLTYGMSTPNYDRGRKFTVDYLDNKESANIAFGRLGAEFERTKVAPELDGFRFATYAGKAGTTKAETLSTGQEVLDALMVAKNTMDENEVPSEQRICFITPTLHTSAKLVDLTKNTGILGAFTMVEVPQTRMYSAIDMLDGKTAGEEKGGFKKATDAKDINFLVIHKPAIIQAAIRTASSIIEPEENADADAYIQKNRRYGIADVYDNKTIGIYVSTKA